MAVFGANGAGKSTLCYLLSGMIPNIYGGRRRGRVEVCGIDPWDHPINEIAQRCCMVLQDPEAQLFMPSLEMELAFGPANLGVPREEIMRRVEEALEVVGLKGLNRRNTNALSGGQKQRAALASVLTILPDLLVLDEPTSQLDPLGTKEVLEAIRNVREGHQVSILMTTHKTEEVMGLVDRCMVLKEGRVVALGPPEEVLSQVDLLEEAGVQPPTTARVFSAVSPWLPRGEALRPEADPDRAAGSLRRLLGAGALRLVPREVPESPGADAVGEPILQVQEVTFSYPGTPPVTALKEVSLDIRQGEFVGLIGQNGSGKSTLVKALVGLLRPQRGRILFKGEDLSRLSVGNIATRVGLVLQNPDYQLFSISAEREIAFGLENIGLAPERREERIHEVLEMVGLEHVRETFPFKLSFGDRRKLAVAAVLALGPEVLIMDEPTTAQDYRGRYLLAELAQRLRERDDRTIIMISHDMDLIARYADRLVVMYEGRVLLDGPTREVFREAEALRKTFLAPPTATQLAAGLASEGMPADLLTVDELLARLEKGGH